MDMRKAQAKVAPNTYATHWKMGGENEIFSVSNDNQALLDNMIMYSDSKCVYSK